MVFYSPGLNLGSKGRLAEIKLLTASIHVHLHNLMMALGKRIPGELGLRCNRPPFFILQIA